MNEEKEQSQNWVFTFGYGHEFQGGYAVIHGTYISAREEMIKRHGLKWAFQYSSKKEAGVEEYGLLEVK